MNTRYSPGKSIITIIHNADFEKRVDRIIEIANGKIIH